MHAQYNPIATPVASHSQRIAEAVAELVTLINDQAADDFLATPEGQRLLEDTRWHIHAAILDHTPAGEWPGLGVDWEDAA